MIQKEELKVGQRIEYAVSPKTSSDADVTEVWKTGVRAREIYNKQMVFIPLRSILTIISEGINESN